MASRSSERYLAEREEIARAVEQVSTEMFRKEYAEVFSGTEEWKAIKVEASDTYDWQEDSTYIRLSPFFDEMGAEPLPVEDIRGARILAMLGDSVTTDHISPAGSIKADSPAGRYLQEHGVAGATSTPMVPVAVTMR